MTGSWSWDPELGIGPSYPVWDAVSQLLGFVFWKHLPTNKLGPRLSSPTGFYPLTGVR